MRVQPGNSVLIAALFGVAVSSGTAAAQTSSLSSTTDWATCPDTLSACSSSVTACCTETASTLGIGNGTNKPILIPMDRCHQSIQASGNQQPPGAGAPGLANGWCVDPSPANSASQFHAYGLVYRMMQMGVPIYWIVNPTKTANSIVAYENNVTNQRWITTDIDMWVMSSSITTIPGSTASLTACATGCPVTRLTSTLTTAAMYSRHEFPLRGSAFLVPGTDTDADGLNDRDEFNTFWNAYGDGTPGSGQTCAPGQDCYDFRAVSLYEINANAQVMWRNHKTGTVQTVNTLPVGVKLNYKPPRVARVKSGGNVSEAWLEQANLDDPADATCKQGQFKRSTTTIPYEPVVCDLDEADLYNNTLVVGNFGWAWFDGGAAFDDGTSSDATLKCRRALQMVRTFVTPIPGFTFPGNILVNDTRLEEFEKCRNHQMLGKYGLAANAIQFTNAVNEVAANPFILRYPTNLFMQIGDLPMEFAASSTGSWTTNTTAGYNNLFLTSGASSTLKRLVTRERTRLAGTNLLCGDTNNNGTLEQASEPAHLANRYPWENWTSCDIDPATAGANGDYEDLAAYGRFNNDPLNGVVFYIPGNQLGSAAVRAELRMVLNSLIATPQTSYEPPVTSSTEVSRATPIVPSIDGTDYIVQGTYVYNIPTGTARTVESDADADNFRFPYSIGHMRAREAAAPTNVLFDAGCNADLGTGFACPGSTVGIPASRTIFTNSVGGDLRGNSSAKVTFDSTMASAVKDLMKVGAPQLSYTAIDKVIARVKAGIPKSGGGYTAALGGVDRSTVAVIQSSEVAGSARPLMVYFGAADGMLHAVCAQKNVALGCVERGHELWAFIPRKMLPYLRLNNARIDGSPRVLDAYIDADGAGGGGKSWRTVLVFHISMGDYTFTGREPAIYALDITDPQNPALLWEYAETSASTFGLGRGLTLSAGPTTVGTQTKYLVWAQTNNLGTSGAGSVITSIDLETGTKYRQVFFAANPNPRTSPNDPMVRSAIPGGTVPVDLTNSAKVTQIMFNDVYGRLWLLNPDTLVSVNGTSTPLFNVANDYRAMGARPAVYSNGGAQYAVFGTGGYADPSNTTWPIDCCASNDGSSCANPQPTTRQVCSQNNSGIAGTVFPMQYAVAVKIDTTATSTSTLPGAQCDNSTTNDPVTGTNYPACTDTRILFRRDLGIDQRASSQATVIGTDIFLTTDNDNANRGTYGTGGANTGQLYQFGATGAQQNAPTTIFAGVGGIAASNNSTGPRTAYAGAAGSFGTKTTSTSGTNVTTRGVAGVSRKLWLRTE